MPFQPKQHNIDFDVLQNHFHLPMAQVAKKFDVCLTFFKKICRQHGIKRWPYRKLKSLEKKITTIKERVEDRAQANLSKLNDQLTQLRGLKAYDNYFADEHRAVEADAQEHTASSGREEAEAVVEPDSAEEGTELEFDPSTALAQLAAHSLRDREHSAFSTRTSGAHSRGSSDSGATMNASSDESTAGGGSWMVERSGYSSMADPGCDSTTRNPMSIATLIAGASTHQQLDEEL